MSLKYQEDESEIYSAREAGPQPPAPTPVYSIILIAAYGLVSVLQLVSGLDDSILAAGFVKSAFLYDHEYWRILTGTALHGGILHVAMNSYALFSFGRIFEMLANRAHLAIVFLLAGIGGGLLSLALSPQGISVGASGGIVGLIGYLAIYAFRRRDFISPEFRKSLLINIGFILIYGLALSGVIDNYAHVGGLITGAIYGFFQIPADPHMDPRQAGPPAATAGLASLGIYIAVCGLSILLILRVI